MIIHLKYRLFGKNVTGIQSWNTDTELYIKCWLCNELTTTRLSQGNDSHQLSQSSKDKCSLMFCKFSWRMLLFCVLCHCTLSLFKVETKTKQQHTAVICEISRKVACGATAVVLLLNHAQLNHMELMKQKTVIKLTILTIILIPH